MYATGYLLSLYALQLIIKFYEAPKCYVPADISLIELKRRGAKHVGCSCFAAFKCDLCVNHTTFLYKIMCFAFNTVQISSKVLKSNLKIYIFIEDMILHSVS